MSDLEKQIESAIESVKEPSGKGLVSAGLVRTVDAEGSTITIDMISVNWPEPIKNRIRNQLAEAIKKVDSRIANVSVLFGDNTSAAPSPGPAPQPQAGHSHGHSHQPAPGNQPAAGPGGIGPQLPPPNIKRIIAVGSGKGGVGKSTIATSLAYALKEKGRKVGLMDADMYGPSVPHLLGVAGATPDVANGKRLPIEVDGLKLMSIGFLVPRDQAVVWRGPLLHKSVQEFLYLTDWGTLDDLVIDLPPGTGDVALSLSQMLPITGAVVVCTPQDVALLDARKAFSLFQTVRIPVLGVVENMSFFICPKCETRTEIFGHGGAESWSKEAGIPFLGSVPINLGIRLSGDAGKMRDNFVEGNPIKPHLMSIADNLLRQIESRAAPQAPVLEIV